MAFSRDVQNFFFSDNIPVTFAAAKQCPLPFCSEMRPNTGRKAVIITYRIQSCIINADH